MIPAYFSLDIQSILWRFSALAVFNGIFLLKYIAYYALFIAGYMDCFGKIHYFCSGREEDE